MTATTFLHSLANKALGVLTQDVEPALLNLFKTFSEGFLTKMAPVAVTEVAKIEGAAITAAASGNWDEFGAVAGTAFSATVKQAIATAQTEGVTDATIAVNTGLTAALTALATHPGIQAAIATGTALPAAPAVAAPAAA